MSGITIRSITHLHRVAAFRSWPKHMTCGLSQQLQPRSQHIEHQRALVSLSGQLPRLAGSRSMLFVQDRGMAKGKSKVGKADKRGKKSKPKVELDREELNSVTDFDKMIEFMDLALDQMRTDFIEQLSLRTSLGAFDRLIVETPDGNFPLLQLAQIVQKNPQLVVINMASMPQYVAAVKAALVNSGLNVNPQQDGTSLFVPLPKVTREHREKLAKNAKMLCEKTKEKLRSTRNKFSKEASKNRASHSEDVVRNVVETIDVTLRQYVEQAEGMAASKQQELLDK